MTYKKFNMKKIIILAVLALSLLVFLAPFTGSASAASASSLNQGTCNAHVNGMPSVDGHNVPGLAHTPFADAEVAGHMQVPHPPACLLKRAR